MKKMKATIETQTARNYAQRTVDEAEKVIEEALIVRKSGGSFWRIEMIIPSQNISSQRVVAEEAKVVEREEDIREEDEKKIEEDMKDESSHKRKDTDWWGHGLT